MLVNLFSILKRKLLDIFLFFYISFNRKNYNFVISENKKYAIVNDNILIPYNRNLIAENLTHKAYFENGTEKCLSIKPGIPLLITANDIGAKKIEIFNNEYLITIKGDEKFVIQ